MEKITFKITGYILFKKVIWSIAISFLLILLSNVIWAYFKQNTLIAISLFLEILITYYLIYFSKKTKINLLIDDDGLEYEAPYMHGLKIERTKITVPWHSIISAKIIHDKKGPLQIKTANGLLLFWHPTNIQLNNEIAGLINNKINPKKN